MKGLERVSENLKAARSCANNLLEPGDYSFSFKKNFDSYGPS